MASGAIGAQGYSNQMVAGLTPSLDFGDTTLTYQLGLTSIPPTFNNQSQMVSPLNVKQTSYYTHNFGKRKKINKLNETIKDINFLLKMF